ncbi:hypothetical protein P1X14_05865 [Sphingomonas sp. AOB5]|uniref:hypothetical protein n=1 Tax=Sphingomonas sp. AOB5 TaxID=3034017 RepID=UPI0023F800F0|nr:hypothetical protein [Sphingomonas sp. AOB5]MDF7774761.1 hypothetical protein [Sphingomonas sp. AOB5]
MHRADVNLLDCNRTYWVPIVIAPCEDWKAAPGCYPGARFVVDRNTLGASRDEFATFASKFACLSWIMRHRSQLNRTLPGATISAVRLDRWLLGLD